MAQLKEAIAAVRDPGPRGKSVMSAAARDAVIHGNSLKLPAFRRSYETLARQVCDGGWAYQAYLREPLGTFLSRHSHLAIFLCVYLTPVNQKATIHFTFNCSEESA